jgi:sulfur carrier protein
MTAEPTVYLNDQPRRLPPGATLSALLGEIGLADARGVAVAVNGAVVSRTDWRVRPLASEDRVLVIQATQGG